MYHYVCIKNRTKERERGKSIFFWEENVITEKKRYVRFVGEAESIKKKGGMNSLCLANDVKMIIRWVLIISIRNNDDKNEIFDIINRQMKYRRKFVGWYDVK